MNNEETESVIRKVLKNDVSLLFSIIGVIWAFVAMVVLPIQKIQVQLAALQDQMASQNYQGIMADHAAFKSQMQTMMTRQDKMQEKLDKHLGQ